MLGYWNDKAQTKDTIDQAGWLHSGDLGVMDDEGYLQIVGRIKEMIIRGGENIYPREVEEFLYTHPKIAEVQVFGIPDAKFGEMVCAWVISPKNS
ncbi:MAG: fatty-acyl-CoA synthase [Woeseiaceae bacterium]|jgi:fatty-acyl-CoA synthase